MIWAFTEDVWGKTIAKDLKSKISVKNKWEDLKKMVLYEKTPKINGKNRNKWKKLMK